MGSALMPLAEVQAMAAAAANSKLFGVKTQDEALALMLLAQAEGLHPMRAVQQYHIIQGRPAMKSEAILARFQEAGGVVRWLVSNEQEAKATFTSKAREEITVHWTIERAKQAGLAGKDNWRNYAPQMLRARCIAEGVRAIAPGCILGMLSTDEAEELQRVEATVTASEPGKGVAGLAKAVAAIAPPPAEAEAASVSPERLQKLKRLRVGMRKDGIATIEQARQYVADNMGGLVVNSLDELNDQDLDTMLGKFGGDA